MHAPSFRPRILFVTPKTLFLPTGTQQNSDYVAAKSVGRENALAETICDLFEMGADVHLAQADYRKIFRIFSKKANTNPRIQLPFDRVHLAEDRTLFYAEPLKKNSELQNIKISLVFQREVINHIIRKFNRI